MRDPNVPSGRFQLQLVVNVNPQLVTELARHLFGSAPSLSCEQLWGLLHARPLERRVRHLLAKRYHADIQRWFIYA